MSTSLFSCHYEGDSGVDSYEQQIFSIIAGCFFLITTFYIVLSLARLLSISGHRKYKATLMVYFSLLIFGFLFRALHNFRMIICYPVIIFKFLRYGPLIIEYVSTMSIICQLLDLLETPSIRLSMDRRVRALKISMWAFIVVCIVTYAVIVGPKELIDPVNVFVIVITAVCLLVELYIYVGILGRMREGHNKAYKKLRVLIRACMLMATIIFAARIVYHLFRLALIDPRPDLFAAGGKIYRNLILVLFLIFFQVLPIVVLNEYAMRFCVRGPLSQPVLVADEDLRRSSSQFSEFRADAGSLFATSASGSSKAVVAKLAGTK